MKPTTLSSLPTCSSQHTLSVEVLNAMAAPPTWAPKLWDKVLYQFCDNATAVVVFQVGPDGDPLLQVCTRQLWLLCARDMDCGPVIHSGHTSSHLMICHVTGLPPSASCVAKYVGGCLSNTCANLSSALHFLVALTQHPSWLSFKPSFTHPF